MSGFWLAISGAVGLLAASLFMFLALQFSILNLSSCMEANDMAAIMCCGFRRVRGWKAVEAVVAEATIAAEEGATTPIAAKGSTMVDEATRWRRGNEEGEATVDRGKGKTATSMVASGKGRGN
ncbi:hypothetical protein B296_00006479, partial [Ensete ventricosum]